MYMSTRGRHAQEQTEASGDTRDSYMCKSAYKRAGTCAHLHVCLYHASCAALTYRLYAGH